MQGVFLLSQNLTLSKMNLKWLDKSTPEKIFEFLNERETLCTPGYLLRRQIQMKFSELLNEAAENAKVKDFADLTKFGNVAWDSNLVEELAELLQKKDFAGCGKDFLKVSKTNWQDYLNDDVHCNRATAIKLIFALEMDDATATKFLLSNDNELLSLRNPFDYACKACLECHLSYADAVEIFNSFDAKYGNSKTNATITIAPSDEFTQSIKSETITKTDIDKITPDEVKKILLRIMKSYKDSFTPKVEKKNQSDKKEQGVEPETEYAAGYSHQNIKRLRIFLKYLTLIYKPTINVVKDGATINKAIKIDDEGVPKTQEHLVSFIIGNQQVDLPTYKELNLPARGELKRSYDNIPFNKNILIPLNSLSKSIRSILRAIKFPQNAQAADRTTVFLLIYFFITEWYLAKPEMKDKIYATLNNDIINVTPETTEENFLYNLEDFIYSLEESEGNIQRLIDIINIMLRVFEFNDFCAPFVLDRFILICLLSLENFKIAAATPA